MSIPVIPEIDLPINIGIILMALEGLLLLILQFDKQHISSFAARKLCHALTGMLILSLNTKYFINRLFIYGLVISSLIMTWELIPGIPNWRFGIYGDVGITVYLLVVGLWYFLRLPIIVLAPVFFADPAGAVVGKWASREFPQFNPRFVGSKTTIGSLSVFVVSFVTLHYPTEVLSRVLVAITVALVEAVGGKYDNLNVTAVVVAAWMISTG